MTRRIRQKATAWAGLVLLAVTVLAAAFAARGAPSVAGSATICTPTGMRAVGHAIPSTPSSEHERRCVFCLPLMQAGLAPPPSIIASPKPVLSDTPMAVPKGAPARPVLLAGAALSRAPPAV